MSWNPMTALPMIESGLALINGAFNLVNYLPAKRFVSVRNEGVDSRIQLVSDESIARPPSTKKVYVYYRNWKDQVCDARYKYGIGLVVISLAASIVNFAGTIFIKKDSKELKEFSIAVLKYAADGVFQIIRSGIERRGWIAATVAYDLSNTKIINYDLADSRFDIQKSLFDIVRTIFSDIKYMASDTKITLPLFSRFTFQQK